MSDADPETIGYIKANVAREHGLPETMAHRLAGANIPATRQRPELLIR